MMNLAIDFSDEFKSTSSKAPKVESTEIFDAESQDAVSFEDMPTVDDSKWIIEQLHICNINLSEGDLENASVSTAIIGLLAEKARVYAQNKELIDENSKMRNQLNNSAREKEKTNEEIAILKQDARVAQGKVSAMQTEQRQLRNRWLEEKTDLENKVHQSLALQTHATATLRKKEKDYDKLQLQLSKLVKESNKSNKAMMVISKPLKANSTQKTQLEKAEITAAALREAEINHLRTSMQALEKTNELLQKNVQSVTASMAAQVESAVHECTEEFNRKLDRMRREYEESVEKLTNSKKSLSPLPLPLPPKSHCVSTSTSAMTPPPGSLVNTYLANTPGAHARQVLNEIRNSPVPKQSVSDPVIQCQLTEALAVIKEQDRLIKQALMSSLPSINEEHHLKRVYTPVRAQNSGDAPYANCPDSIMKIMNKENSSASKVNEDMSSPSASYNEWENELFGHASPYTQNLLVEAGVMFNRNTTHMAPGETHDM